MSYPELDLFILKAITTSKKHAIEFVTDCDVKLFSPEVFNIANQIINYIKTSKEIPTLRVLTERLSKGGNEKLIESISKVWAEIESTEYNLLDYKHDLGKLKDRFAEKLILSTKDILNKSEPGSVDINKALTDLNKTVQTIKGLNQEKAYESKTIKEYLPTFVELFNAKKNNPDANLGLMTKYSFIDFATNGLKPADFILIAGESGFGKSLFLNNIAIQTWMQDNTLEQSGDYSKGYNIIYFSLEMPYEDCFNRLISRLSGVPSRKIENNKLSKEEIGKVKKALDFISRYPYSFRIIDIADASANDIERILEDCTEKYDAIFIDYLGIMRSNKEVEDQDWLKQGIIAYETRAIARKYKLPVFSAVQLNRKTAAKDSSENIGLSRLARSGTIATHATHVIQIENRDKEELYPDFLYHMIKNRKGPKGKGILYKNLACTTLIDKPTEMTEGDDIFKNLDDISEEIEKIEDLEL